MAAAAANAPVAQLCFGSGASELNLKSVQQRVTELIRVIDSLLMEMQTHGSHWTGFLDKLAVINMTYMQIMAEVRPLLRQYTVYPKYVDNPGIENALPEMLASRLLPEQVEQEASWKAEMPGGLTQLAAQPEVCVTYADGQVTGLQDLVGWLTNVQHILKPNDDPSKPPAYPGPSGLLDPKGTVRKEIEDTSRKIGLAAAAAERSREQAGSELVHQPLVQQAQAAAGAGQKRKRVGSATPEPAAVPAPTTQAEADSLIAKIMSGSLWPPMSV